MIPARDALVLPLHFQNEVIHPDGAIHAGFGGPHGDREPFLAAAAQVLAKSRAAVVPLIYLRMAFQPGGTDLPDNCALYRNVKAAGVMQEGSWGTGFVDALGPQPGDAIVSHNRVNSFFATDLAERIAATGRGRLVLMGVATHSVVEHTARHAADMGLAVTIVTDACSAWPRERHDASLAAIDNLVDTMTADELGFDTDG